MNTNEVNIQYLHRDITNTKVVAACADNTVKIYKLIKGGVKLSEELHGHSAIVTKALFINQGEIIISSDYSGKLILWKCEGEGEGCPFVNRLEISASQSPVYDISAVFNDGQIKVYCACNSGILKTITIDTNFNYKEESKELHSKHVTRVSSNSEYIITATSDFEVGFHSNDESVYFHHHQTNIVDISIAPSNTLKKTIFATCDDEGNVFIYDKEDNEFFKQNFKVDNPCNDLRWGQNEFKLIVGHGDCMFDSFVPQENWVFKKLQPGA